MKLDSNFLEQRAIWRLFGVVGLVITTGCYSEIPYGTEEVAKSEAPAYDPTSMNEAPAQEPDSEEPASEPETDLAESWGLDTETIEAPAPEEAEVGVPWETQDADSEESNAAAEFFAGLQSKATPAEDSLTEETPAEAAFEPEVAPAEPAAEEAAEMEESEETENPIGDFLEEAYVDVPVAESKPEEEAAESLPNPTAQTPTAVMPRGAWTPIPVDETPVMTPPQVAAQDDLQVDIPLALQGVPKKKRAESAVVGDRYSQQQVEAEPEPKAPTWEVEPEPTPKEEPDTTNRYANQSTDFPPLDNWEQPAEPNPPAIEAAPSVRVEPANTRHLSWLLGAKLGLARLAVAEGTTDAEAEAWITESKQLSDKLGVDPSGFGLDSAPTPGGVEQRVLALLESAAKASGAITQQHGADHAALFEASLKANSVLVLYKERPDLVRPIARAVRDASQRAGLAEELWNGPLFDLEISQSDEEIYDAVTLLYSVVENELR